MIIAVNPKETSEYLDFSQHYTMYCKELAKFGAPTENVTEQEIQGIFSNKEILPFWIVQDNKRIGLFLLGIGTNKHPLSDYFIGEFYIFPEYRRKHFGELAVKEITDLYPGKYCLYILKENLGAYAFWTRAFRRLGYRNDSDMFSQEIALPNTSFYFFSKE